MPWRLILPLLVAAGLVTAARAASAAEDKALQQAKDHFDEGQTLFIAGQFAEAAVEFQKAYDAKPFPAFLFNIGVCHERRQDFGKAIELYQRYLEDDPRSPDRQGVEARIASLRKRLEPPSSQPTSGPAAPAPPPLPPPPQVKGMVVIESEPQGAAIYLDDKRNGVFTRTPFHGTLPTGHHVAIIELQKYEPVRRSFSVPRPDAFVSLWFGLKPQAYLGWIEIKANVPGVDVYFDEKRGGASGRTPYTGFLRPGKRTLFLEKRGYQPVTRVVQVAADKEQVVEVELQKVPFGWLRVSGQTTSGARILLDGKPLACASAPCQAEVAPGQYTVEVQRKGWKSYRTKLAVRQATETQLRVKLETKPPRTDAYISFGVSAAFLAGGLACALLSNSRADAVQTFPIDRPVQSGDSRFLVGKALAITADGLFAIGALTGGLGLYYLLRNEGPDSYGDTQEKVIAGEPAAAPARVVQARPTLRLFPSLGPGSLGLTGRVEF